MNKILDIYKIRRIILENKAKLLKKKMQNMDRSSIQDYRNIDKKGEKRHEN